MSRRIAFVPSTVFNVRGGIPRFNQMLCLALDDLCPVLDLEGWVVSLHDTEADYERAGRPWRNLRFRAGGDNRRIFPRLVGLSARHRFDLMLIGLLGMTPVGLTCRPFLGRGYGFVAHGTESWSEPRWTRRFAARRASFAFAVSNDTARALVRATGIDPEVVRRLPNTLDPGFDAMPEVSGIEPRHELLTVSRLWAEEKMKGIDHTIRAFARLAPRHPDLLYRVIGKGTDKQRLVDLAHRLDVGDRVVFEQDVSDDELADSYRRCLAFVLPSGQEGFGIVFLEAMRFGRPCVGGLAGGTPEVIADGESGILVPFGDEAALESALERLLGDPDLRRRMGEAGRQRLLDRFTFASYRARLERHLRELLGLGDGAGADAAE